MRQHKLAVVAVGAAVMVACATATIKYRQENLAQVLKFSHKKHVEEADCSDCHEDVEKSTGATRGKFIGKGEHGGCAGCHEDEIDEKKCAMCHIGADRKIELTRVDRHLKFSHAAHQKRAKEGCEQCHAAVASTTTPGKKLAPDMKTCAASCHQQDLDAQRCSMCHSDLTQYKLEAIGSLTHGPGYVQRHGALARGNMQACAQCHDQTHCADCHGRTTPITASMRFPERIQAGFIHRGDWLGRHAVAARAEPAGCRNCHGTKHCTSCHAVQGLTVPLDSAAVQGATRKAHGADIMTPGAPGFHGRLARRDISACASCHDQGTSSNCVSCHRVGELGGNPHPTNFKWRNKREACRSNGMCATCHVAAAGCP